MPTAPAPPDQVYIPAMKCLCVQRSYEDSGRLKNLCRDSRKSHLEFAIKFGLEVEEPLPWQMEAIRLMYWSEKPLPRQ